MGRLTMVVENFLVILYLETYFHLKQEEMRLYHLEIQQSSEPNELLFGNVSRI